MIPVDEAVRLILDRAEPLGAVRLPLAASLGHVLAESVSSDIDSPPHHKSLVDGYAVRAGDLEGGAAELEVVEEITAGAVPARTLGPGQCARIMTGAPIPEGADAVVMIERTQPAGSDRARIDDGRLTPGQNIMRQGASLRVGHEVLSAGTLVRPIEIGLLAEVGRAEVPVHPRPSLAVVSTGNELVPHDQLPTAGRIRNSNGPLLESLGASAGSPVTNLGIAIDDREALAGAVARGLERQVLVLSGGVSAGVLDLVPGVLRDLGVEQVFHRVDLKPGKPVWFGVQSGTGRLVFGLPGNPVSTLVCFELFVRPALRRLAGHREPVSPTVAARLTADFTQRGDRVTYHPSKLWWGEGGYRVEPVAWGGSADQRSVAEAGGLAIFAAGQRRYGAGETVEVLPLN